MINSLKIAKEILNESSNDLKVIDLAKSKVRWKTSKGWAGHTKSKNAWGIIRKDGKVLAREDFPTTWRTKSIVEKDILPYVKGEEPFRNHYWMDVKFAK